MSARQRIQLERNLWKLTITWIIALGLIISGTNLLPEWYGYVLLLLGTGGIISGPEVEFACTYCNKKLEVNIFREKKKCKKCETLHVIDWRKKDALS